MSAIRRRSKTPRGIAYLEAGQGEPLVLIHGVGMRLEAWEPQIAFLAQTHRVIAVDMPGHGESDPLPRGSLLADYVRWFGSFLDELGLVRVNVCGHSMGALIAGGSAATFGERIARVALINGVYRRSPEARAAVIARSREIENGQVDLEAPLMRWFGEAETDGEPYRLTRGWLSEVDQEGYSTAYAAFAQGDEVYADAWPRIGCPALFLTGNEDPNSTPAMSKAMASAAPAGEAVIVAGRHMVNLTAPTLVNEALSAWLMREERRTSEPPFDPRALRDAFGAFMTGVTVITSQDSTGQPIGFTANSFTSVSLSPPLLLVCLAKSARSHATMVSARGFAVNVLAADQKDVSNTFARPVDDRFATVQWRFGPCGSPIISGSAAWFDCELERTVDAGDHTILLGRVGSFENAGRNGLGYARGGYFTAALEAQGQTITQGGGAHVGAVAERAGLIYLLEDEAGRFALPNLTVDAANPAEAIAERLEMLSGLAASVGFLFSVYSDRKTGRQHIVYRATLGPGAPSVGQFFTSDSIPFDRLDSPQTADILRRFALESSLGNFGVYFGNETAGSVHPLGIGG